MRALAILLLALSAFAQSIDTQLGGSATKPPTTAYPKPGATFRQPVAVNARIMQGNGGSFSHLDAAGKFAWDYQTPVGTPIVASRDGVVIKVRQNSNIGGLDKTRFWNQGNSVFIDHRDGTASFYLHLQRDSVRVRAGDWVLQGELIARSGDTGFAGAPHLHYTAVDMKTRQSTASKFTDWARNDGVPHEGDSVRAARAPVIPQARLDLYRGARLAARNAESAHAIGIAWRVLHDVDVREKEEGYYYAAPLKRQRARLRAELIARLKAGVGVTKPSDSVFASWARMCTAIDGARDKEVVALAKALRSHGRAIPGDTPKRWLIAKSQVKSWTHGLRAEFANEPEIAREALLKAARAKTAVQPHAQTALRLHLKNWRAVILVRATRTVSEASLCQGMHRKRILDDAGRWLKDAERLQKIQKKAFPKEPRSVDKFEKLHDDAIENLKKNKG